jgi:hypothetical protein
MTRVFIEVDMGTVHNVPDAVTFAKKICCKIQEQGYNATIIRVDDPIKVRALGLAS